MKRISSRIVTVLVIFAMVLSLFPANLAVAAAKTTLKTKSVTLNVSKTSKIVLNNKQKTSTYSFTSNDKSVATVSKDGEIKAVKAGKTNIVVTETAKGAKKSSKIGSVSVTVKDTAKDAAKDKETPAEPAKTAEKAPVLDANSYYVDLSSVSGDGATYDEAKKSVKAVATMFSFALLNPVANGESVTVTVKGTYNGSQGFRSWLVDDGNATMSTQAGTDTFPTTAGKIDATYTLTASGNATRLFFKGPTWDNANVDDVTITQIIIKKN